MLLSVAGVVIALEGEPEGPRIAVDGAARAFVVPGGTPDIRVHARWGDLSRRERGRRLFHSGALWELHERGDQLAYSFTSASLGPSPYRRAVFDPAFREGRVTLDRGCFAKRPAPGPLEYPLDELMVINRLTFEGGVEVHGCGVIDGDGCGYLFAGQSGAGKSTIANIWARHGSTVVSDDRVVLRAAGSGVTMHGTPWHGDAEFASPACAPLTRILLLRQAPHDRIVPLSSAQAAALLFSCTFPVFHDPAALDRTLAVIGRIAAAVPIHVLEFAATPHVTDYVRGLRS